MPRPAPDPSSTGEALPRRAHGALRKRWRWVGAFAPETMLCVALADVGGVPSGWWAVLDRRTGTVASGQERLRPAARIDLADGGVVVRGRDGTRIDLRLTEDEGITTRCPHGDTGGWTWTRKQAGIAVRGTVAVPGAPPIELRGDAARAVVDDTLGYHAHRTEWRWAAGIGTTADGRAAAWNLVAGVNDPPTGSERALWLDGEPTEVAPASFSRDLTRVSTADGLDLRATVEAVRAHREGLGPLSSRYRQPFARVEGELPGGLRLAGGLGVLEHHVARW